MKRYYAADNYYGNETSTGFYNTWRVIAFSSKAARDAWVEDHYSDMSVRAIKRDEALHYVKRGGDRQPMPFTTEFWGIVKPIYCTDLDGVEGCLGHLAVCRPGEDECIRFYS